MTFAEVAAMEELYFNGTLNREKICSALWAVGTRARDQPSESESDRGGIFPIGGSDLTDLDEIMEATGDEAIRLSSTASHNLDQDKLSGTLAYATPGGAAIVREPVLDETMQPATHGTVARRSANHVRAAAAVEAAGTSPKDQPRHPCVPPPQMLTNGSDKREVFTGRSCVESLPLVKALENKRRKLWLRTSRLSLHPWHQAPRRTRPAR